MTLKYISGNTITFWLTVISCTITFVAKSQMDPQISSNAVNLLPYNPGYAGSNGLINAFGVSRQQWVGTKFSTSIFGFDTKFKLFNKTQGAGITIFNDNTGGILKNASVNLLYSYRFKIWNGEIGIGCQAGINNLAWIADSIKIPTLSKHGSEVEGEYQLLKTNSQDTKFDAGVGSFFEGENFYAGISLSHLTKPKLTINDQGAYIYFNRVLYITSGYRFGLKAYPKLQLEPSLFFKTDGKVFQTDFNINGWWDKKYFGGLGYRIQDAFVFLAGIKLKNDLFVGYCFDLTTSQMKFETYGSHEIFLKYSFDIDTSKKKFKYKSIRIL